MSSHAYVHARAGRVASYEVHRVDETWVVASVDVNGNRYLVGEFEDAVRAHLRATWLGRKLRAQAGR